MAILFIVVALVFMIYLLLVRPRQRQLRKQQNQMDALQLGDEVVTAGGIYGTVRRLDEDEVRLEIAPELEVRVARRAIAGVLTEHEQQSKPAELELGEEATPEAEQAAPEAEQPSPELEQQPVQERGQDRG